MKHPQELATINLLDKGIQVLILVHREEGYEGEIEIALAPLVPVENVHEDFDGTFYAEDGISDRVYVDLKTCKFKV